MLGVAFFDLSRIARWTSADEDERVAAFLQRFYRMAAERVAGAGGRTVKLMGDAGLAVFPTESVEDGVAALDALAREVRELGAAHGFDVHLNASVHVGPVLAGTFGPPGLERFDVIGKTVNVAARLGRRGLTLSSQAFRCLSPEGRGLFEKVKPPITYRSRR
jgi:class 3 adenylate cyclase